MKLRNFIFSLLPLPYYDKGIIKIRCGSVSDHIILSRAFPKSLHEYHFMDTGAIESSLYWDFTPEVLYNSYRLFVR